MSSVLPLTPRTRQPLTIPEALYIVSAPNTVSFDLWLDAVLVVDSAFPVEGYQAYEETASEDRWAHEDRMAKEDDKYRQEWGS